MESVIHINILHAQNPNEKFNDFEGKKIHIVILNVSQGLGKKGLKINVFKAAYETGIKFLEIYLKPLQLQIYANMGHTHNYEEALSGTIHNH